jgi:isopentenyldiphosphate isomerase
MANDSQVRFVQRGVHAEPDEEEFDLLSENGDFDPLGITCSRKVVHQKGLWHAAVYCFVFNPEDEILIQKRSMMKKVHLS